MAEDSNEYYWDTFFVKVEDKLFCVPRYKFVQSSEVFADMFLLPSGPGMRSEGQDRDNPIVLEGYKKEEFTCLLKVMYPTSLIPGGILRLDLQLKKEEWVSVLKLSTIWNMTKIRQCAIHWLSTNVTLSPIEKILLARAHRVGAWLEEAVTNLTACKLADMPTLEDFNQVANGWETVARILWIRNHAATGTTIHFRRDTIKCGYCSNSITPSPDYRCGHAVFTAPGNTATCGPNANIYLRMIQCPICRLKPFNTRDILCNSCRHYSSSPDPLVLVTVSNPLKIMIEEMFGKEIRDYE